mmetsp:Transcript_34611/g.75753  ORF Transcript_34611/g.75753 Transcript_34611/m.75753 type:complete len:217 (+) Transcript_34611:1117-1767(+)
MELCIRFMTGTWNANVVRDGIIIAVVVVFNVGILLHGRYGDVLPFDPALLAIIIACIRFHSFLLFASCNRAEALAISVIIFSVGFHCHSYVVRIFLLGDELLLFRFLLFGRCRHSQEEQISSFHRYHLFAFCLSTEEFDIDVGAVIIAIAIRFNGNNSGWSVRRQSFNVTISVNVSTFRHHPNVNIPVVAGDGGMREASEFILDSLKETGVAIVLD